jgi:TolA-binding protein
MSDVDSKPTAAEARIARNGLDALAAAKASGRIDRIVQATSSAAAAATARAPRPARASRSTLGTGWSLAIGTAALAGVVALASLESREVTSKAAAPQLAAASTTTATGTTLLAPHEAIALHDTVAPAALAPGVDVTSLPDVADPKRVGNATSSAARQSSPARAGDAVAVAPNGALEVDEDAATLFERANTARRSGDHATGEKLYARLVDAHPGTREAMTSRVILGRMHLARGAAAEALASFDAYLEGAPRGTLEEQALIGRAKSLQVLGRRAEERAAWRALLEAFPGTASRPTALARAGDLP